MTYEHAQNRIDRIEKTQSDILSNLEKFGRQLRVLATKLEVEAVLSTEDIEHLEEEGHVKEKI